MSDDKLTALFETAQDSGQMIREAAAHLERSEHKMWLAVRQDLFLSRGKAYTQAGHCYGRLYLNAARTAPDALNAYLACNEPKISVRVKNEAGLLRVAQECEAAGIPFEIVQDAGRSEIAPGTYTFCAFGPAQRETLPKFLARLQKLEDKDLPTVTALPSAEKDPPPNEPDPSAAG